MKTMRHIILVTFLLVTSATAATADVYEVLHFTNYTREEIYVQLSVYDDCCTHIYDIYVRPNGKSTAYFWAANGHATYSACAYGEISDAFYGCMDGGISDYNNNIYFDLVGDPYLSTPSDLPAEVYRFENPYHSHDVVVVDTNDHYYAGVGCFVGSLFRP